jgi:hypothetical protein
MLEVKNKFNRKICPNVECKTTLIVGKRTQEEYETFVLKAQVQMKHL